MGRAPQFRLNVSVASKSLAHPYNAKAQSKSDCDKDASKSHDENKGGSPNSDKKGGAPKNTERGPGGGAGDTGGSGGQLHAHQFPRRLEY